MGNLQSDSLVNKNLLLIINKLFITDDQQDSIILIRTISTKDYHTINREARSIIVEYWQCTEQELVKMATN